MYLFFCYANAYNFFLALHNAYDYFYKILILIKSKIVVHDTTNVTNIISYNMNSYIFERHQKYGILITKFVIDYN